MAAFAIIDADGHVTETWEQIARHLEEPYRRRPLQTPFFPQDGWDRRLLGSKGNWAGDARSWEEALETGGMAAAVLFPTLGLTMPFLRDAEWAVALSRAYNTMLYKEVTSQSRRLKGVALLPLQDPAAAARELERAVGELGFVGGMVSADSYYLLGHARFDPDLRRRRAPRRAGVRARRGHGHGRVGQRAVPQVHPGAHRVPRLRPDAPVHLDDLRRDPRALPGSHRSRSSRPARAGSRTSCSGWTRSGKSAATPRPSS